MSSIDDATPDEWHRVAQSLREGNFHVTNDAVESPAHYNHSNIECIEAIKASMSSEEFKGYLKGNAFKYIWRYTYKGKPEEDLKKAQWYLAKLIENLQHD